MTEEQITKPQEEAECEQEPGAKSELEPKANTETEPIAQAQTEAESERTEKEVKEAEVPTRSESPKDEAAK